MNIKSIADKLRKAADELEGKRVEEEVKEPAPMFDVGEMVYDSDEKTAFKLAGYGGEGNPMDTTDCSHIREDCRKVLHIQVEGEEREFQAGDRVMVKPMNGEWEPAIYLLTSSAGYHRIWSYDEGVGSYFNDIRFPNPGEWVSK